MTVPDRQLGSGHGAHSRRRGRGGELQGAREGVVVGQRQRGVAHGRGGVSQLSGKGGAIEEAEGRVGVQLHVGRASHG